MNELNERIAGQKAVFAGINAALQVTTAGVQLWGAIDSLAKQTEAAHRETVNNRLSKQIAEDIAGGVTGYKTDNDGKLKFTGLSKEAERIKTEAIGEAGRLMGGISRGNAGRARAEIEKLYAKLEAGAAVSSVKQSYSALYGLYETNMETGLSKAVLSGDDGMFRETLSEAQKWMAPELFESELRKWEQKLFEETVAARAVNAAETGGMSAADAVVRSAEANDGGPGLSEGTRARIMGTAAAANSRAARQAVTDAEKAFDGMIKKGDTIGAAAEAARKSYEGKADEAVIAGSDAASAAQRSALSKRFAAETENATPSELRALDRKYKSGAMDYDYAEQPDLLAKHKGAVADAIAREENARASAAAKAASAASASGKKDVTLTTDAVNDSFEREYDKFVRFSGDGRTVLRIAHDNWNYLTDANKKKAENALFGNGGKENENPLARRVYDAAKDMYDDMKVPQERRNGYDDAIYQARLDNKTDKELAALVEEFKKIEASKFLTEGSARLDKGQKISDKTLVKALSAMESGGMDALRYRRTTSEGGGVFRDSKTAIGGEAVFDAVNQRSAEKLNEILAGTDTVGPGVEEYDADGDPEGRLRFEGTGGAVYRLVAKEGAFGYKFSAEVLGPDGTWAPWKKPDTRTPRQIERSWGF